MARTLSEAELALIFRAIDQATPVQEKVRGELDKTEAAVNKKTAAWNASKAAVGAFAGVVSGVLVGALADAARAAAEDAASSARLEQAIENVGERVAFVAPLLEKRIALGQQLAFADDETRASLTRLLAVSASTTEAMELNAIAMDVARGKGISLAQASEIVAKAQVGQTAALAKLGIELREGATAGEALRALQEKFAGQAEVYGQTTAASIFRMQDAIGEWKESIGAALGPAQQYIAMLPGLQAGFVGLSGAVGSLWPHLVKGTAAMWGFVAPMVVAAAPIIAVAAAVGLVVFALWQIAQTAGVVIDNWDKVTYLLGRKADEVRAMFGALGAAFVDFGRGIVEGLWSGISRGWGWLTERVRGVVSGLVDGVKRTLGIASPSAVMAAIGDDVATGLAQGITRHSPEVVRAARAMAADGVAGTKAELMAQAEAVTVTGVALGGAIATGIATGIRTSPAIDEALKERLAEIKRLFEQAVSSAISRTGAFLETQQVAQVTPGFGAVVGGTGKPTTQVTPQGQVIVTRPDGGSRVIGGVAAGRMPRYWTAGPDGQPIPIFREGGVMAHTGLAHLEKGERVSRPGEGGDIHVHVEVHGSAIGLEELATAVRQAVVQGAQRGAFRGVIPTVTG